MAGTDPNIAKMPAFPGPSAGGKPGSQQPGYRQQLGNPVPGVQPGTKAGGNGNSTVTGKR